MLGLILISNMILKRLSLVPDNSNGDFLQSVNMLNLRVKMASALKLVTVLLATSSTLSSGVGAQSDRSKMPMEDNHTNSPMIVWK